MPKSRMRRASMTMCSILFPAGFPLPGIEREARGERLNSLADALDDLLVRNISEHRGDQAADLAHLLLFESARCCGGRPQPEPARVKGLVGIERDGVLVDRDAGGVERVFGLFAADAL